MLIGNCYFKDETVVSAHYEKNCSQAVVRTDPFRGMWSGGTSSWVRLTESRIKVTLPEYNRAIRRFNEDVRNSGKKL